jgi:phosphatidylglycerophosphate synthase
VTEGYSYRASVKSESSDEPINTYLLRPLAGILVRLLYRTRVTPNQVTIFSTLLGVLAGIAFTRGEATATAVAGLLVTAKDIADAADGQLARAKQQFSRAGRFLDSIGDILVNAVVFAGIALGLSVGGDAWWIIPGSLASFLGISLRVSYHVFYHTAFLHEIRRYEGNRLAEVFTEEDRRSDATTRLLQRIFLFMYGWQDGLMARIDRWSSGERGSDGAFRRAWYLDLTGVRLSGFLGLGTELLLLTLCALVDRTGLYLLLNVTVMNAWWAVCILYRRWVLRPRMGEMTTRG